jgi:hypothetical protein
MTRRIADIDGTRYIDIEANHDHHTGSVFIWGPGFSYEFDKESLIRAIAQEFVLVEPLDYTIDSALDLL